MCALRTDALYWIPIKDEHSSRVCTPAEAVSEQDQCREVACEAQEEPHLHYCTASQEILP
jgi:hypothetical protein